MNPQLLEVALVFGKLGATSFGGPLAHLALMEEELVQRRKWLSRQRFLDIMGASNLIPGPNSTEVAIHLGLVRAGTAGMWVAGAAFILPAMLMVMAVAMAYVHYGKLPAARGLLDAVQPVVLAVIGRALWLFARTLHRNVWTLAILAACFLGYVAKINELLLLCVGAISGLIFLARLVPDDNSTSPTPPSPPEGTAAAAILALAPPSLSIFLVFLKFGTVIYGSGYVLLAFLHGDLVERLRWITNQQLLDAVAIGQVTPGPLFTTATFIGYLLQGVPGSVAATAGIFLPSFLLVGLLARVLYAIRASARARGFLDGVNAASLALMAGVTLQLAQVSLTSWINAAVLVATLVIVANCKINSAWPILTAALTGCLAAGISVA